MTDPHQEESQVMKRSVANCEDLLNLINEYVDGTIQPADCAELEQHMQGCNPCQVVIDNLRKTITLYKQGEPYDLPVEFQHQLHESLRRKWKECRDCPPHEPSDPVT